VVLEARFSQSNKDSKAENSYFIVVNSYQIKTIKQIVKPITKWRKIIHADMVNMAKW
jgi:hypothetical protein